MKTVSSLSAFLFFTKSYQLLIRKEDKSNVKINHRYFLIIGAAGGALLKNLDKRLMIETGLPVSIVEDPLLSVVLGTGRLLKDFDLLKSVKNVEV